VRGEMNDRTLGIPIAFLLAAAAAHPAVAKKFETFPAMDLLRAGSLSDLLPASPAKPNDSAPRNAQTPSQRVTQWFNGNMCFNGAWRRC
jgi:hypothetical protein